MLDIQQNLLQIRNEIDQITKEYGRSADAITLVAVSKTKPLELIKAAYRSGQRDFAENYVQEGVEKIHNWNALYKPELDRVTWHFIGQIQSNKCASIAQNFDWVHSISSFKHAQRLDKYRQKSQVPLNTCIQVQLENNSNRNGLSLNEVDEFLPSLADFKQLNIRGLMCVLPEGWLDEKADYGFDLVCKKYNQLKTNYPNFDNLSLGMSGDYVNALRAGSTMLRLGSAIFGSRPTSSTK